METILFNTVTQQPISKVFPNGYFVDGQKPALPSPIVELEVVREPLPGVDQSTNIVEQVITVTETQYIFGWEVTPIPPPPDPPEPEPWAGELQIGQAILAAKESPMLENLQMDGSVYFSEDYPVLASLLPGLPGWANGGVVVAGTPSVNGAGNGVKFNNAGTLLAVAHANGSRLTVVNTTDWTVVPGTPNPGAAGNGLDFSPDDSLLAIVLQDWPRLRVYNTSDWSLVSAAPTPNGPINRCAFSPDGNFLAVAQAGWPRTEVFNVDGWDGASGFPVPGAPGIARDVAWSPDSTLLAIAHESSPYITIRSVSGWGTVSNTANLTTTARGVAFNPTGTRLAIVYEGPPYLTILDTATWNPVAGTPTLPGPGRKVSWDQEGAYLAVSHEQDNRFTIYRTTDWTVVSNSPNINLPPNTFDVDFDLSSNELLAVGRQNNPGLTVIASAGGADEFVLPQIQSPNPNFEWRIRGE